MKRLIITEEERRSILLKHGSQSLINEAADSDVVAIQTKLGVTADGIAGPKTVKAILTKLGGSPTPDVTTVTTTIASTTVTTTIASTTVTTTIAAAAGKTFSAVPVAGATTLESACGDRKTNKDFRPCKKAFRKASGL
jgi:peptidoglycan hydrolase-like protein with peptidoglycan-binding domain